MGCFASSPVDEEGGLEKRINLGLEEVKDNLVAQLGDQKMMLEVLKALVTYINKEVQDSSFKTFLGYAVMGNHLLSPKATSAYPPSMGRGILALTKPQYLCYADCDHNFASRAAVVARIRAAAKKRVEDAEEGGGAEGRAARLDALDGASPSAGPAPSDPVSPDDDLDEEDMPGGKKYAADKEAMLSVLEPYCDILEGLLSKRQDKLRARFLKITKMEEDQLKNIRRKLSVVTAMVKVFSPSDAGRHLKLPAFVGPESYGKSTLINHIIGRGTDSDAMPTDPGMGTQVVCKVSPGTFESFRMASDKGGTRKGSVKANLTTINSAMKAKSERGELGIRDMDMILAQKEFHPPVPMEFLDVPGIKETTAFHTSLALSMASSLVLVCGKVEYLSTQLADGGDLQLLKDIVKELDDPLPIQCVVSFKVSGQEFTKNQANYVKLLKQYFPNCEIKDPLWMDFFQEGVSMEAKGRQCDIFMGVAAQCIDRVIDPYKKFLESVDDMNRFATAIHEFTVQDLTEYQSTKDTAIASMLECIEGYDTADGRKVETRLSEAMGFDVGDFLKDVRSSDAYPRFHVGLASEMKNPVTIANALLIDCRLATMSWLVTQGRELHYQSFGEVYSPVAEMCGITEGMPDQAGVSKAFVSRVSQAYECFNTQDDGKLNKEEDMQYWMKECCCKIAPYLDTTPFTWFVTGFYIVVGDSKNKTAMLSQIQKVNPVVREWSSKGRMAGHLRDIKFGDWVMKCEGLTGRDLIDKQFEVMEECCETFREIAEASHFLDEVKGNDCMEELLEFSYVMMERIFAKKNIHDATWEWTDFAKWLKKNAGGPHELRAKSAQLAKAEPTEVAGISREAYELMKTASKSSVTWKTRLDRDMPECMEELQACTRRLQSHWGGSASAGAALLISHSVKESLTKASGLSGGRIAFPETAKIYNELTCGEHCKVSVQEAPGPNQEDSFIAHAFEYIARTGSHVAIYMRRPDTQTYDPLDREKIFLEKLATQPHLTHLFVLWTPSQAGTKPWTIADSPKWDVAKEKVGSYLRVDIVAIGGEFKVEDFLKNQVVPAISVGAASAKANLDHIARDVFKIRNDFRSVVSEFRTDMESTMNTTAAMFHDSMTRGIRKDFDNLCSNLKVPKRAKDLKFQIPSKGFLAKVPEFTDRAVDRLASDAAESKGDDAEDVAVEVCMELLARAFLFNVMLGQVVSMSRFLAAHTYDKVLLPLWDKIGGKFFMSGEDLKASLAEYVAKEAKTKSGEGDNPEDLEARNMHYLLEMSSKQNFEHMYVGCVVYMLMPALYAIIIPCIIDMDEAEATDKTFRHNIARARSMVGDQDPWDQFVKYMRESGQAMVDVVKPYSPWR
mmetsp:Transcript_38041/g.97185  ORF Transcript_38041/g.97185 Transcript_38041/m.97185 type:complete len:1352 (-) Transcript_38041:94-4149(-)